MKQDHSHSMKYFGIEKCSGVPNTNRIVISIEQQKHIGQGQRMRTQSRDPETLFMLMRYWTWALIVCIFHVLQVIYRNNEDYGVYESGTTRTAGNNNNKNKKQFYLLFCSAWIILKCKELISVSNYDYKGNQWIGHEKTNFGVDSENVAARSVFDLTEGLTDGNQNVQSRWTTLISMPQCLGRCDRPAG